MGSLSPWHLMILAVIALLVFGGRGKLSGIMGDAAKGIRAFRDGLKEEPQAAPAATPQPLPPVVDHDKDPVVR
ncbi:MAG: twin-arginine translocase TatA/TatE family subunit [Caulobacteraceae bacterium]|nr:twin-arginine translocase TatA/TatE family subunit [Caulobacteraceae bacterium]